MATNIYSLVVTYNAGGQFAQNVLHYQFDDSSFTDTASAAAALIAIFDSTNTTKIRAITPSQTSILSYKARSLTTGGGFESIKLITPAAGSRTGNLSAIAPSPVIILFPTGNARPRGRTYLPGVTDTDLVDGEFTTAFRNTVGTNLVIWTAPLTLSGGGSPIATPVIYHRKPAPAVGYVIEYARLSDTIGQLFRRQKPA